MGDKSFVGDELELQETLRTTTTFDELLLENNIIFNQTTTEIVSENKADNLEFFNETIILKGPYSSEEGEVSFFCTKRICVDKISKVQKIVIDNESFAHVSKKTVYFNGNSANEVNEIKILSFINAIIKYFNRPVVLNQNTCH
jgi:hypothetical protein